MPAGHVVHSRKSIPGLFLQYEGSDPVASFFNKMISAGNEQFAGSSIGPEGWQCEISMSRLSGESSLFLTFHLDRSLCGEACVALFCSATGCAGPASAFNWADECEARLTCWCRCCLCRTKAGLLLLFCAAGCA